MTVSVGFIRDANNGRREVPNAYGLFCPTCDALYSADHDWYEMREKLWSALEEKLGYPGLAFFEQLAWKSHKTHRCAECGESGELLKFDKPALAQAVPHYWLCRECDEYLRS